MNIYESAEDYLEMMLMLRESKGYIRSTDIADGLGVTKPSVSYAVKRLRENGYINMAHDGEITLTEKGMEIASATYDKHKLISALLQKIGVSEKIALRDACKIEHDISDETYEALLRHCKDYLEDDKKEN
ncbi:MAG: metal-dependent transcriptional regulator [Firmicutes bacterium]|jgi:Mn-dependent DtxR family transcriptional regulator|nr:metal-dependent transcriptional regulator [Bacillota bacterium]